MLRDFLWFHQKINLLKIENGGNKHDEFVKSRKLPFSVIPAKAGIQ